MRTTKCLFSVLLCLLSYYSALLFGAPTACAEPIASRWNGSIGNWGTASRWIPSGTVPNNTPSTEYSATINAGTVTTDIAVTLAELTLNGGRIQLNQRLHAGSMTVSGDILGDADLLIDGDLLLRSGTIANDSSGVSDNFAVGGAVIKRGYGKATLATSGQPGDYEIVIEQGEFRYGNGGLGTKSGAVTVAVPEFARIETSVLSTLSDDLYLNNARGFSGTGALVSSQSRSSILGDIFLGEDGAIIGLVPGGITDGVMTFFGGMHGGSLKVAGRGTVNVESDNNTYTGHTVLGADGELTLMRLRGSGRLLSTSAFDLGSRATLQLDNQSQAIDNRIADSIPILLRGGTIDVLGNPPATASTEDFGALRLIEGSSTVRVGVYVDGIQFDRLERSGDATIDFAPEQGAITPGQAIRFREAPSSNHGILGSWATVNNLDFAAYDPISGIVPLADRVTRPSQLNAAGPTDHVRVSGSVAPLTADRTVATLAIQTPGVSEIVLGGHLLTLRDGGLLRGSSDWLDLLVSNGRLTAGEASAPAMLNLRTQTFRSSSGDPGVRITASIVDNPSGGALTVVKSGEGTVDLSGDNSFTGGVQLQEGSLRFSSENALPSNSELVVHSGTVRFDYEPTNTKAISRLTVQQGGSVFAPRNGNSRESRILVDADEYLLESGTIGVSLAGDGVLRKVGEGVVEMTYESPNFSGPVIVEQGLLVAGSRSVETVPRALGLGETTIMPGGTLVHSAVLPNVGYMRLDAKLNLEGGDVGIGPSIRTSRWDFNGAWRVTANSRLLLFDPRGNDEITTPQGNLTTPTVNLLQDLTMSDGVSLTALGAGLVQFAGGLSLSGYASIVAEEGTVNVSAISATTNGATLSLRGKGNFQIPRTLSTTGAHFTIEIASDAKATPATGGAFSIADGVTLEVNGRLANSNSQPLNMFGGKVAGVGALGNVLNNGGELSPGNSIGVLTVGDYQQGIGGALTVELFGGPEVTSDQLRAHVASLNGTVHALLAAGADVLPGDVFDVVVADQILATDLTLQPQGFAGRLDVVTLSTGVDAGRQALRLTVVPEPAMPVMAMFAAILLLGLKARRR